MDYVLTLSKPEAVLMLIPNGPGRNRPGPFRPQDTWCRAVRYLRETGQLRGVSADIPELKKVVESGILGESVSVEGLAEWYKARLRKESF